jgi:UDP-3-O-[3-hydroxymyristoyl] N-acetylglucosamine deacetylase/3-hydroxyacyl-[acyl-carrier-protein] dehydratase
MLGDLSLIGRPIRGRIVAVRSGHALNHRLSRALLDLSTAGAKPQTPARPAMDIRSILRLLPHRFPMMLVDRVLEIEEDRRAVGIKNVTMNEPFFQGHYPERPIMPGVLIVEAMCQLSGLMLSHKLERTGKIAMLLSLDKVKLRKAVVPGDQMVMETQTIRASSRLGEVQCHAYVSGELVAEAQVKFLMVDAEHDH